MPATDYLIMNAAKYPDEIALVEVNPAIRDEQGKTWRDFELVEATPAQRYRREITWKVFNDQANRFAHQLIETHLVEPGTKVAILLMNCLEWLPIYFGVLKAGCVAVPLNYRYTADEIKYCLELSDAEVLVFGPEFIGRVEQIADRIPQIQRMYFVGEDCPSFARSYNHRVVHFSAEEPNIEITDDDPAAIYFSSGTTGFPKAILHNHRSLLQAGLCEQQHHGQTRDDCFLCIPPLYHTGAKIHWFGSLVSGSKGVILRGVRPDWILRTVSEEHCTLVWLLVPWAQDILDAIDDGKVDLDDYRLDQWRLMHIGAQPVPPSLVRRWKKQFPNHQYDNNYGLSEGMGPGSIHLGVENFEHLETNGVPGWGWEAEIRREDGSVVEPGSPDVGELCLRGNCVMVEYYNNPEATAESLRDGWLYTGDVAKIDADGFITLVDRAKDVIITGGENLYPVQIEAFIRGNDDVKDVAVIGVPDERLGEIACAIIEVKEGHELTEEAITDFCLDLPRYKRPRRYIFAEVPRNSTGKIDKPGLRERYGAANIVAQEGSR